MTASLKTVIWHPPTIGLCRAVQYAKKGGGAIEAANFHSLILQLHSTQE